MNLLRALAVTLVAAAAAYVATELARTLYEAWARDRLESAELQLRTMFDTLRNDAAFEDEVRRSFPRLQWELWQLLEERPNA